MGILERASVAGAVVAGGRSRRMGRDKALIPWRGEPLIVQPLRRLSRCCREVFIVARDGAPYDFLGHRVVPDRREASGALVGIESALAAAGAPFVLVVACDMPCITDSLVDLLLERVDAGTWVIIPESPAGPEPLLAVYGRCCLPAVSALLDRGEMRISALFAAVPTIRLGAAEVAAADPAFRSFVNLNTPDELRRLEAEDDR